MSWSGWWGRRAGGGGRGCWRGRGWRRCFCVSVWGGWGDWGGRGLDMCVC